MVKILSLELEYYGYPYLNVTHLILLPLLRAFFSRCIRHAGSG